MKRTRSSGIGCATACAALLAGPVVIVLGQPDVIRRAAPPSHPAGSQFVEGVGPDLIVADVGPGFRYYGSIREVHAYAVGTHACNFGDERVSWIASNNQHPVMTQGIFRLMDDRFEQIGMSWIWHEFYAVSWDFCQLGCPDPTDGTELGVGCSSPSSANVLGIQRNLSRRSDVNAHTGYFPYPWTAPPIPPTIGRRLQVHQDDLDPDLNEGALYFVQGHYINADDAAAGNADNNASYRPLVFEVPESPHNCPSVCEDDCAHCYIPTSIGETQREQPAIRAWREHDPFVVEVDLRVPGEGLFLLAGKATDLNNGTWRYAYAIENLNSDRSARSFRVPLPFGAVVTDIGFHDVDYHSWDNYDLTDWRASVTDTAITWSTGKYEVDPDANALRFSTLYNFYFTVNATPADTTVSLGLFKPGEPTKIEAAFMGPQAFASDCNTNGISDYCDVDCDFEGCGLPCGESIDCNANGVPDECEPDCNENGVADACDILECNGALWCSDCNDNRVPDGCDTDCDGDGHPDDCVPPPNSDGDDLNDCYDLCPLTTPPGTCSCPLYGECCWQFGTFCLCCYTAAQCLYLGGEPECVGLPCRSGCILGDADRDGDLDLYDFRMLQNAFSGGAESPGFVSPSDDNRFADDYDDDGDIDLDDFAMFHASCSEQ